MVEAVAHRRNDPGGRRAVRAAADTGGTFTDVVLETATGLVTAKVPSTPDDPSRAVLDGLRRLAVRRLDAFVHGTTVGTNALLERRGARVAFVTNAGFRDLLHIGRQARPHLYDLDVRPVAPLVDRASCFEVAGRLGPDGAELVPLDLQDARRAAGAALDAGAEAVAICFLHAYANPAHERAAAEVVRQALRDAGAGEVPVVCSHEVLPELREFERASTTVANAYLRPPVGRYLAALERQLAAAVAGQGPGGEGPPATPPRSHAPVRIMQSNGGVVSARRASKLPVHTVLSGPAAGVVAAARVGKLAGCPRVVSFDMGGTSTDVAVCEGRPMLWPETTVAGIPIGVPSIAIHTVGAGGGSLARADAGGVLRVGPRSAGAVPGPACYGRGGAQATVTDANLLRGHLVADAFLGGEMALDTNAARRAVGELARALGADIEGTAAAICAAANAAMARAIKVVTVQRGLDPRDFALVAFGGAGGMHACELAATLGMRRVLIPPAPGLLSALGLLWADVVVTATHTVLIALRPGAAVPAQAERTRAALLEQVCETLRGEGVDLAAAQFVTTAEMRYAGQSWSLEVPWQRDLYAAFERVHARRYGFRRPQAPVELVTLRVVATAAPPGVEASAPAWPASWSQRAHPQAGGAGTGPPGAGPVRRVRMWHDGAWVDAAHRDRAALAPGDRFDGPAIVTEYSATTAVPPGWRAHVDRHGILHLERIP